MALLFLGLIYAFSMLSPVMCESFGLESSAVGLTFNIMMVTFSLGAIASSQLTGRIGLRNTLLAAGIAFLVGFAGTGLLAEGRLMAVYVFYGVIGGIGVGMGYNTIISVTNSWFPDRMGLSSGVLMMGFSLSTLLLGNIAVSLANGMGLGAVLVGIGIIGGAAVIACAFVLRRPTAEEIASLVGIQKAATGHDPADDENSLKTPAFYLYFIWAVLILAIGLAAIGSCSSDAQLVGMGAAAASLLAGLVSLCNGLSRLVIGQICDKRGTVGAMAIVEGIALAATALVVAAFATSGTALFTVGILLCGFSYGCVPVVNSAFVRVRYGQKNYAFNLSLFTAPVMFASIINVGLSAVVGDSGRMMTFVGLLAFALAALVILIVFRGIFTRDMTHLDQKRADLAE